MQDVLAQLLTMIQPHLAEAVALIIAALVAQAVAAIRRWTGMQISQRHADRLSAAITRAVALAAARRLDGAAARELVLGYLRETVPDALATVRPSLDALALRIEASLAEARG